MVSVQRTFKGSGDCIPSLRDSLYLLQVTRDCTPFLQDPRDLLQRTPKGSGDCAPSLRDSLYLLQMTLRGSGPLIAMFDE